MLRQNGKRFYRGLYVIFKLAPGLKKNTVCLTSYSPLNEGHVKILTNSMLRTETAISIFEQILAVTLPNKLKFPIEHPVDETKKNDYVV